MKKYKYVTTQKPYDTQENYGNVKLVDIDSIMEMSPQQIKQILPTLEKRANSRLRSLKKHGYVIEPKHEYYTIDGKFKHSSKATDNALKNRALLTAEWLNKRTSSVKGFKAYKEYQEQFISNLAKSPDNETVIKNFLSSKQWQGLVKYLASEQLLNEIEKLTENNNVTLQELEAMFSEYEKKNIPVNRIYDYFQKNYERIMSEYGTEMTGGNSNATNSLRN